LTVPQRAVLLDTSFILALENRDDAHHERAKSLDRKLVDEGCAYVFHWGILLEIADGYARISRRSKALQLIQRFETEQGYILHPITEPILQQALALYRSRSDKEWGLTACVSFVLMNREGITEALTADIHFRQAGFIAMLLEK